MKPKLDQAMISSDDLKPSLEATKGDNSVSGGGGKGQVLDNGKVYGVSTLRCKCKIRPLRSLLPVRIRQTSLFLGKCVTMADIRPTTPPYVQPPHATTLARPRSKRCAGQGSFEYFESI